MDPETRHYVAFRGTAKLAGGDPSAVAAAVYASAGAAEPILVFDESTGRSIDLDLRGTLEEVRARYAPAPRKPGRPKLGVVAREVTLLPRHWDWLNAQPGGASVALRRLVDEARRGAESRDRQRLAREAAYHFLTALCGNEPGYEEATRALFAGDGPRFRAQMAPWPADVREQAERLAAPGLAESGGPA